MIGQLNYVQQLDYVLPPSQNSDFNDCVSEIFCDTRGLRRGGLTAALALHMPLITEDVVDKPRS